MSLSPAAPRFAPQLAAGVGPRPFIVPNRASRARSWAPSASPESPSSSSSSIFPGAPISPFEAPFRIDGAPKYSPNDPAPSTVPTPAPAAASFDWTASWYPVTALDNLNPTSPTNYTVLGYDLAIWRDAEGTWRAFRDACPHRRAPLSEGAIDPGSGHLLCAYHGFQFSGTGACVEIPQAASPEALATATASPRACATAFPTATSHGLLWVWLQTGGTGLENSKTAPLREIPSTDSAGRQYFPVSTWYVREMQVPYEALMENSADPSHVHFTHAGFIGAPDRAGPIAVRRGKDDAASPNEFRFLVDDSKKQSFRDLTLRMPCMLWAASEGMKGGELALLYFIVPVAPGRSRLLSLPLTTNPAFKIPAKLFHAVPWMRHLFNHTVAAQDAALLHRQGAAMAAADFPGWRRGFFLPTAADSGTIALRKWLDAVGGVAWGPNVDPSPASTREAMTDREKLFDNFNAHTRYCPHCIKALKSVRALKTVASIAAVVGLVLAAAAVGSGGTSLVSTSVLVPAVAGALAWGAAVGLGRLEESFLRTRWRHSENPALVGRQRVWVKF